MRNWINSLSITYKFTFAILLVELLAFNILYLVLDHQLTDHVETSFQSEVLLFVPNIGNKLDSGECEFLICTECTESRTGFPILEAIELNERLIPTVIDESVVNTTYDLPDWLLEQIEEMPPLSDIPLVSFNVEKQNGILVGQTLISKQSFHPKSDTQHLYIAFDISTLAEFKKVFSAIYGITLTFLLIATYFINRIAVKHSVNLPINRAVETLDSIAAGEMNARITSHHRNDEMGQLSTGINRMANQLEEMFTEINYQMEEQQTLSEELLLREKEINALNASLEDRVQQRTIELQQANRDLEAFAFTISHDLRQPIQIINGYTDILDNCSSQTEKQKRYTQIIRQNLDYMDHMIQDILALSRTGRSKLEFSTVDTAGIVQMILDVEMVQFTDHQFEINTQDLPVIQADPTLVQQIFQNLISNAIKFSMKKAVTKIDVGLTRENGNSHFYVRDNGAGFDPEKTDQVFTLFKRLHSSKEFPGNGIGMAIVKRAVERHGGKIWAESQPDQGACFRFTLWKEPENQNKATLN